MVLNHIGLSGGKDSTALWGWAIHESGYRRESIRGTFSDTQNEYAEVYDQIATLSAYGVRHGVSPVDILPSVGFFNLALKKRRFPSARARFCTDELKVFPFIKWLQYQFKCGHSVINHLGVRRSESTERRFLEEWGERTYGKELTVKLRRPILDWTVEQVWEAHKRFRLPINPLYFQGRRRVGCRLCIMSNKEDVKLTAKLHPEVIDEIREWEKQVGEFHSFFSMDTVPEIQRSREIVAKDGTKMKVPTIDDVVRWSRTCRGGRQYTFDLEFEDDDSHLPCKSGWCE